MNDLGTRGLPLRRRSNQREYISRNDKFQQEFITYTLNTNKNLFIVFVTAENAALNLQSQYPTRVAGLPATKHHLELGRRATLGHPGVAARQEPVLLIQRPYLGARGGTRPIRTTRVTTSSQIQGGFGATTSLVKAVEPVTMITRLVL